MNSAYKAQIEQWQREARDGRRTSGVHHAGLAHIRREEGGYADDVTLETEPLLVSEVECEDGSLILTFDNGHVFHKTLVFNRATERYDLPHYRRLDIEQEQNR